MKLHPSIQRHIDTPAMEMNMPEHLQQTDSPIFTDAEYRQQYEAQKKKGLGKKTSELIGAIPSGAYSVVADQWIPALQDESLVSGLLSLDPDAYKALYTSSEIAVRDLNRLYKSAQNFLSSDDGLSDEARFQKWLRNKKENDNYFGIVRTQMAKQAAGGKYEKDMLSLPDFVDPTNVIGGGAGVLNKTLNTSIRNSIKYGVGKPAQVAFRSLELFGTGMAKVGAAPARLAEKLPTGIIPYRALQGVSGYAVFAGGANPLSVAATGFTVMETMGTLGRKVGRNAAELARIFTEPSSHARFLFKVSQDAAVAPSIRKAAAMAYRLGGTKMYDAAFDAITAGVGAASLQAAIQFAAGFNAEEIGSAMGGGAMFGAPIGMVGGQRGSGLDTRVKDESGKLTSRSEQGIKDYLHRKADMESQRSMKKLLESSPDSAVLLSTLDQATGTAGIRMNIIGWEQMSDIVKKSTGKASSRKETPAGNYDPSTRTLILNEDQLKQGVDEAAHTIAHEIGHDHMVQMIGADPMTRRMVLEDFQDVKGQEFFFYDNNNNPIGSIFLNQEAQEFAQAYHDRIVEADPKQAKKILHDAALLAEELGAEHFANLFAKNPNVFEAFNFGFRANLISASQSVLAKFGIVDDVSGQPIASNAIQKSGLKNQSISNLYKNFLKASHRQILDRAKEVETGVKIKPKQGQTDSERFKELFGGVGLDLATGGTFSIKDDIQFDELLKAEVLAQSDPDMKYAGVGKGKEGQNLHPEFIRLLTEGARDPAFARMLLQHGQDAINSRDKISLGYRSGSKKTHTGYNPFYIRNAVGYGWQISPKKPSKRNGIKVMPNLKLMAYNQDVVLHNIDVMAKAGLIKNVEQFQKDLAQHAKTVFTRTGEEGRINTKGMGENELFAMAFGKHTANPESMINPRHKDFFSDPNNALKKAMVSYDFSSMVGFANTGEAGFAFDYRHIRDNYMPKNYPTKQDIKNYMPSELTEHKVQKSNQYMPSYTPNTKEFKDWFGKSRVVDSSGTPLVLSHGTYNDFTEFDRNFASDNYGRPDSSMDMVGSWFSTETQSRRYADPDMPMGDKTAKTMQVYLSVKNPYVVSWKGADPLESFETIQRSESQVLDEFEETTLAFENKQIREKLSRTGLGRNSLSSYEKSVLTKYPEARSKYIKDAAQKKTAARKQDTLNSFAELVKEKGGAEGFRDWAKSQNYDGVHLMETIGDSFGEFNPADMWVAFEPTQIKSATGNTGAFDPNNPDIRYMPSAGKKPSNGFVGYFHELDGMEGEWGRLDTIKHDDDAHKFDRLPFRYVEDTKTVHWWEKPTQKIKDFIQAELEAKGYKVDYQRKISMGIGSEFQYNEMHGLSDGDGMGKPKWYMPSDNIINITGTEFKDIPDDPSGQTVWRLKQKINELYPKEYPDLPPALNVDEQLSYLRSIIKIAAPKSKNHPVHNPYAAPHIKGNVVRSVERATNEIARLQEVSLERQEFRGSNYMPNNPTIMGLRNTLTVDVFKNIDKEKFTLGELEKKLNGVKGSKEFFDDANVKDFFIGKKSVTKQELGDYIDENAPTLIKKVRGGKSSTAGLVQNHEKTIYDDYTQAGQLTNYEEHIFYVDTDRYETYDPTGGHWSDDAATLHYRKTTRRLAENSKFDDVLPESSVYYLEEVQSDIHQHGKRTGYMEQKEEFRVKNKQIEEIREDRKRILLKIRKNANLQAIDNASGYIKGMTKFGETIDYPLSEIMLEFDNFISDQKLEVSNYDADDMRLHNHKAKFFTELERFLAFQNIPVKKFQNIEPYLKNAFPQQYSEDVTGIIQELHESEPAFHDPQKVAEFNALNLWMKENAKPTDAPFKKSWHGLAIKQAILDAYKTGHTHIAIPLGANVANVYSLDKSFKEIIVGKSDDGRYNLFYESNDGWGKRKESRLSRFDLERQIGREHAELAIKKIESSTSNFATYRALNVSNINKGMRNFYDGDMVKAAKSIAKELGLKEPTVGFLKNTGDDIYAPKIYSQEHKFQARIMSLEGLDKVPDLGLYMPASQPSGADGAPKLGRRDALRMIGLMAGGAFVKPSIAKVNPEPVGTVFPIASKEHLDALIEQGYGLIQNYIDDGRFHSDDLEESQSITNNQEDIESIVSQLEDIKKSGKITKEIELHSNFEADQAFSMWEFTADLAYDDGITFPYLEDPRNKSQPELDNTQPTEGDAVTKIVKSALTELFAGTNFEKGSNEGTMVGYRVMRLMDLDGEKLAVSGANARQKFLVEEGKTITQDNGVFLSNDPEYVKQHYAVHDRNILLKMEFHHDDLKSGKLDDVEPEISVSKAKILSHEILNDGFYMPSQKNILEAMHSLGVNPDYNKNGITLPIFSSDHLNQLINDYQQGIDETKENYKNNFQGKGGIKNISKQDQLNLIARVKTLASLQRKSEQINLQFPESVTLRGGYQPEIAVGHWEGISENNPQLVPKSVRNKQIQNRDTALNFEQASELPTEPKPVQKTVQAYKLFRVNPKNPTELFPLFVDSKTPVPMNQWVTAIKGETAMNKKTGKDGVKSDIGVLAYRAGWHAGDLPIANHIGGKSKEGLTKPDYRKEEQIWAEVEMADDFDWQTEVNNRAEVTKKNQLKHKTAHIQDQVPYNGHYRYKTNPNMLGEWIISGQMKVNRILSDAEVKKINKLNGVSDLRRLKPSIKLQRVDAQTMPTKDGYKDAEHGYAPPLKKRITKQDAKRLNMPANMIGRVAFPMAADRLKLGFHTTRSGQTFELRGGVNHPDLDIHQNMVGWATMEGGVAVQLENAIKNTDGVGLVYLMKEEATASNRSFARIAVDEMMYDMASVNGGDKIFAKYLAYGISGLKKTEVALAKKEKREPDPKIMGLKIETIQQLSALLPTMSFGQRKTLLPKIMSNDYRKEMNAKGGDALFWKDIYKQINDPMFSADKGWREGDIAKVVQFDQSNPRINIVEELGISPDPTYDASFRGSSVGDTITGFVSAYDVFKDTLDYFAFDQRNLETDKKWIPNPERTLRADRTVGKSANRVLQLRGLKNARSTLNDMTLTPRPKEVMHRANTKGEQSYFQTRTEKNKQIRQDKLGSSYL